MRSKSQYLGSSFLFFFYFVVLSVLTIQHRLHEYVLPAALIVSLFTYLVYAHDKKQAKQQGRRTPESHLHFLSLFYGWPGALIAQNKLRHKTAKIEFKVVFFITIILNVAATVYSSYWR